MLEFTRRALHSGSFVFDFQEYVRIDCLVLFCEYLDVGKLAWRARVYMEIEEY
jgi:hypothetical protein